MPRVSPARRAAFQILLQIGGSPNTHCDELLAGSALDALTQADRNLTTALVMGVLRWQLALDQIASRYLTRNLRLGEPVAVALRLGVFQLLALEKVPEYAALSESVELTKAGGHRSAAGLVNAVLRRIAADRKQLALDAAAAHPQWMVDRWTACYGAEKTAAIVRFDQQQPPLSIRVSGGDEKSLPPGAFLTRARSLPAATALPETARIQDEGSQLIAELAGTGARVLDCCAAPGGKTAILAENNPRAEITACDISKRRLQTMQHWLRHQAGARHVSCIVADATALPFRDDFDLILVDAPCSGTGTLARNPEIKLRFAPEDLVRQQQRQLAILQSAFRVLAPGGRLIYSTCSLEPDENEDVIANFLREQPSAMVIPVEERLRQMEKLGSLRPAGLERLLQHGVQDGFLRTIPGALPCDGFFAAILTRR